MSQMMCTHPSRLNFLKEAIQHLPVKNQQFIFDHFLRFINKLAHQFSQKTQLKCNYHLNFSGCFSALNQSSNATRRSSAGAPCPSTNNLKWHDQEGAITKSKRSLIVTESKQGVPRTLALWADAVDGDGDTRGHAPATDGHQDGVQVRHLRGQRGELSWAKVAKIKYQPTILIIFNKLPWNLYSTEKLKSASWAEFLVSL